MGGWPPQIHTLADACTRGQTLIIFIPNAILYPWVKYYLDIKKPDKPNVFVRILLMSRAASAEAQDAYQNTPYDHSMLINNSPSPYIKIPFYTGELHVHESYSASSKRQNAVSAYIGYFFQIFFACVFKFCLSFLVWAFSFVIGWIPLYKLNKNDNGIK